MPKFIGNAKHLLNDEVFMKEVLDVAKSRFNSVNNDLAYEHVYNRTLSGLLAEQTVIDSNSEYSKNVKTFEYDIDSPNYKIEVKSTNKDTLWWSIRETYYNGLKVPIIKYFLDNARLGKIDLLYYTYIDDNYNVFLKYIINAKYVERYLKKSNYSGWYFDHKSAYANKHCLIL